MKQSSISVDFQCLPKLNYAMHQFGVSLIRSFVLSNTSDADWTDVCVKIAPADPFF